VLAVEPGRLDGRDEELGAVGVGPGVRHRHDAGAGVFQGEVLVLEFVAVDGLAAGAVVIREVAALAHEVGNYAVEAAALVAEALLAGAQGAEILRGLGGDVRAELDHDAAHRGAVGGHVEEYSWQTHVCCCFLCFSSWKSVEL